MQEVPPEAVTSCRSQRCGSYHPGHDVHFIQARKAGESPWGWRDATVVAVDGHQAVLAYLVGNVELTVWHHRSLAGRLSPGAPVRLHEEYFLLGTPSGWWSVAVVGGVGSVPAPADPALWSAQTSPGIVDLAAGVALATDHEPGHA